MATITKRTYKSWRVKVESDRTLQRTFKDEKSALDYQRKLADQKVAGSKLATYTSSRWQVRIRSRLAGEELTKVFDTRTQADEWAKRIEGELVKRQFVDYRMADRSTLGDLLKRYDQEKLSAQPSHYPDRARIRKICRHPITAKLMSVIQPGDFAEYRDQRLKGGFAEACVGRETAVVWEAVKPASVNKELELMSRVIALARAEWKLHLAVNPASGTLVHRFELTDADERDRRLGDRDPTQQRKDLERVIQAPARGRRQTPARDFELDPGTAEIVRLPQSEQQMLLRACRYPDWFRPRKKVVTSATLRARRKMASVAPVKARLRGTIRIWAIISFAIETALRRGEMVKLRWEHVHFGHGHGYLDLPGSITKNGKPRIVPLTLRARRILLTQSRASELVFNTTAEGVKQAYKRAKQRIGLTDLRLHDLRHEATSRLFERTNLRGEDIGSITGHNDSRMLKRYYNKRPAEFVKRFQESFVR